MRDVLGGKGANIAEMTRILGPERVPAGFTVTTEACSLYMALGQLPMGLDDQVTEALARLERRVDRRLGDPLDPLLVSVRSGARESMPGMLDTVLNLGLNDRSVQGLAAITGNERFAWDSYRRLVQMFANVVHGVPGDRLQQAIADIKRRRGVQLDLELAVDDLRELVTCFKGILEQTIGVPFPEDPRTQLDVALRAVFDSWNGKRATSYRQIHHIPDDWGTAVTVQQMVFGNKGPTSGSGVAFSRDEITGGPTPSGEFLLFAQGEDIVSGVRNTSELADLADLLPSVYADLREILQTLESHHKDMQDVEFTIDEGRLFILQTRTAKRPAQAAVQFAIDAVGEGLLSKHQALSTIDAGSLDALLHPRFDPKAPFPVLAQGVGASPGAAVGEVVFSASDAVARAAEGHEVVLVRPFAEADDIAGFHAATGVLTSEGGKASHAALVARGMGRPCVVGASRVEVDVLRREIRVGGIVVKEGHRIGIDGSTGRITAHPPPLVAAQMDANFECLLGWADEVRRLEVRANADTAEDAGLARALGAQGIGLCRTEHMFMAADRVPTMRAMILADTPDRRRAALAELARFQQQDFEEIFTEMEHLPVTIRLLDPPLHEFLPDRYTVQMELDRVRKDLSASSGPRASAEVTRLEQLLDRVKALEEANPMLGTRGCRLGLLYPEIYEMQTRAIARAAVAVRNRTGTAPSLEVMIPLVSYARELELTRELVERTATDEGLCVGRDFSIGTMVELPRACIVADEIARHADFFSFGTNDLTQTALGFSRDDIEGKILDCYVEAKIIDRSPFETLDIPGVGELVRLGARLGRETRAGLKMGVCGEHGGDPDSISFFDAIGLDYISCSPYRVPVARVAAACAAIKSSEAGSGFSTASAAA
jgi:pyruvate,orthophosphate dikinase